jgi:glycosyltransferase involved in cell wall biosynthesis
MRELKGLHLKDKKLSIALVGTRGVPANYGGFETCAEEIGKRLVKKGHQVTVYCRKSYYDDDLESYLGMKRVCLPNLKSKSLDTMSHTLISSFHAVFKEYDVCMVFNAANSPFIIPLRLLGKKIALNTDGLEWKRSKWGILGRSFYQISEKISCIIANRIVTDSKGMQDYYLDKFNADSTEIAYGAPIQNSTSPDKLCDFGIEPKKYFLQITRFEPENHPLLTIRTFRKLKTDMKLVLVGGNPYPNDYTKAMEREATENVILPGYIYDQGILRELWCNCLAYIHGNSVGGTNPALLQTMASGCFTISIDVNFNHDVLDDCGIYFDNNEESLAEKMNWALDHEDELESYGKKAQTRIKEHYTWDKIADQYERLFYELHSGKYPWKLVPKFFGRIDKTKDIPN